MEKGIVVTVTRTDEYIIPESLINSFSGGIDGLKESWFGERNIHASHTSRDRCRVGGSAKLISIEKVKEIDLE